MSSQSKPKVSRKEQRRRELAAQKRKRILFTWVPIGIITIVLVGLILFHIFEPDLEGIVTFGTLARDHDVEATFENTGLPPTGGSHNPRWQNCGIYDTPVESSLAVHSLEHGAVWLTYRPDLPDEQVAELRNLVRAQGSVLMSPFPEQEADVVMSAWSTQLVIDSLPNEQIGQFIDRYQGQGPESGASCTGGVGTPIG